MKEARKTKAFAVLHDCPSSPQKMRLVADLVRGMDVQRALDTLKFCPKEAARKVEKLLLSAIANWRREKRRPARRRRCFVYQRNLCGWCGYSEKTASGSTGTGSQNP